MLLKELKNVLYSTTTDIQTCVVWNCSDCDVMDKHIIVDKAIEKYGHMHIDRVYIYDNEFVLSVH